MRQDDVKSSDEKIILFGPWFGEFSYEMSWWVPAVRKIRRERFPDHHAIHVGFVGRRAFYKDFIDEYVAYPPAVQESIVYPSASGVREGESENHYVPQAVVDFFKGVMEECRRRYETVVHHGPPRPGVAKRLSVEANPFGEYIHLTPEAEVERRVRERLAAFKERRPIVAVNARMRTRGDVLDREDWYIHHWERFIERLITDLQVNVVLMGVPKRGDYPGSLELKEADRLGQYGEFIMNCVAEGKDSVDEQLALLKNTACSVYGSSGACTLAYFTNTPMFAHMARESGWRQKLQWQRRLTDNLKRVRIFDKYGFGEINDAPADEVFDAFAEFWKTTVQPAPKT